MHTRWHAHGEAQQGDEDDDQVLEEEEEFAGAAVVVPEGEHLNECGERQTHGAQAKGTDKRDEQLQVGYCHGKNIWNEITFMWNTSEIVLHDVIMCWMYKPKTISGVHEVLATFNFAYTANMYNNL